MHCLFCSEYYRGSLESHSWEIVIAPVSLCAEMNDHLGCHYVFVKASVIAVFQPALSLQLLG